MTKPTKPTSDTDNTASNEAMTPEQLREAITMLTLAVENLNGAATISLAIDPATLPDELEVTGETDSGVIMGIRHRTKAIEGVQFHPESVLTEHGMDLLRNFVEKSR